MSGKEHLDTSVLEKPEDNALIAEYETGHQAFLAGSQDPQALGNMLSAGVFIFWGFLLGSEYVTPEIVGVSSGLVIVLFATWILQAQNARQIYWLRLHRLREIEKELRLEQHTRWGKRDYRTFGPGAWQLKIIIFVVSSLGTPLIGGVRLGFSRDLLAAMLMPSLLFVAAAVWVALNDTRFFNYYCEKLDKKEPI